MTEHLGRQRMEKATMELSWPEFPELRWYIRANLRLIPLNCLMIVLECVYAAKTGKWLV